MALRGQRFELDLDAEEFTAKPVSEIGSLKSDPSGIITDIKEHDTVGIPAAPKFKATTRTGFPEHKKRFSPSTTKQQHTPPFKSTPRIPTHLPPSDKAILHHVGKKYGYEFGSKEKADISEENKRRIANMSDEDLEEARAELMSSLDPTLIDRLLKRASIDDEQQYQPRRQGQKHLEQTVLSPEHLVTDTQIGSESRSPLEGIEVMPAATVVERQSVPAIHFPVPPRSPSSFVPLNPDDPNFLADLKTHYFPDTPHDPSSLSWLQDPSPEEDEDSPYNPQRDSFSSSSLRFSFTGELIPPKESIAIDVSKGLHHHGLAPSSAGYTIPELAILSRSTLPNQRCIAYQVTGRILYRLGRGDFGPRGSELQEGLWSVIEKERVIEMMMREANRDLGHISARAYATEALWLWRKGGGGDRGLLKTSEKIAK